MSCAQVAGFDVAITVKDTRVAEGHNLRARTSVGRQPMGPALVPAAAPTVHPPGPVVATCN